MSPSSNEWLPLEIPRISPEGRWESQAHFDSFSGWFSGHFEERPLLPGVALLALASEVVVKQGLKTKRALFVLGFSKVRFKSIVLPGDTLNISVAPMPEKPEARLDFRISSQGEHVIQGYMTVREEGNP